MLVLAQKSGSCPKSFLFSVLSSYSVSRISDLVSQSQNRVLCVPCWPDLRTSISCVQFLPMGYLNIMASPKIQHTCKQTFLHHPHVECQSHSQAPIFLSANNSSLAVIITLLVGGHFIRAMCFPSFGFIANGVLITTLNVHVIIISICIFISICNNYQSLYLDQRQSQKQWGVSSPRRLSEYQAVEDGYHFRTSFVVFFLFVFCFFCSTHCMCTLCDT